MCISEPTTSRRKGPISFPSYGRRGRCSPAGGCGFARVLEKSGTTDGKKEIEGKTDRNGLAEFPRVEADKLALSATVKGYRSFWRWIRPSRTAGPTHIRLEKWAAKKK
jgi:hypothetical protein